MRHIGLLGLDFADADAATAAAWLAARPADAPFDYVVTPNADHLVRLARQPALKPLYQDALLRLMDFRVVARAASGLGLDAPAVATGSDLTALLLHRHLEAGERIAIVGLAPERLPSLLANCGLAPPLHYNPSMGFERDPRSLEAAVDFVIANPAPVRVPGRRLAAAGRFSPLRSRRPGRRPVPRCASEPASISCRGGYTARAIMDAAGEPRMAPSAAVRSTPHGAALSAR